MAITVKKLSTAPLVMGEQTGLEFSITFDTVYATTGGESLGFGTSNDFIKKCRRMLITKPAQNTNQMYLPELSPGTSDGATNAKLLLKQYNSTTNVNTVREVSTTTDVSAVTMRAVFFGF
jgi:hypothetical protein